MANATNCENFIARHFQKICPTTKPEHTINTNKKGKESKNPEVIIPLKKRKSKLIIAQSINKTNALFLAVLW